MIGNLPAILAQADAALTERPLKRLLTGDVPRICVSTLAVGYKRPTEAEKAGQGPFINREQWTKHAIGNRAEIVRRFVDGGKMEDELMALAAAEELRSWLEGGGE